MLVKSVRAGSNKGTLLLSEDTLHLAHTWETGHTGSNRLHSILQLMSVGYHTFSIVLRGGAYRRDRVLYGV